ncbi:hypothetical protein GCM10023321_56250 [Pseudonocardia eucalypti]|uniref:4Fe-4S ferredoxin-type domain-containing protein n=1 Tax=Pseudonocardia eucalypti TaxID=648755 RepID=A0ABP9QQV3_9PSEU|nr:ferredoxin [Pseudonocardia eucalypti]
MAYVITEACIGQKDGSCAAVCPVDYDELPEEMSHFEAKAAEYYAAGSS